MKNGASPPKVQINVCVNGSRACFCCTFSARLTISYNDACADKAIPSDICKACNFRHHFSRWLFSRRSSSAFKAVYKLNKYVKPKSTFSFAKTTSFSSKDTALLKKPSLAVYSLEHRLFSRMSTLR